MTKVAVFVGSLREGSYNKKIASAIEAAAPEVEFSYVDLASLPLYNEDLEAEFPTEAQAAKDIVESADGVLFITPEYNRSISGVLKNAIDWVSRPWGQNSFNAKPAGMVGVSLGPIGTAPAQSHLRSILIYLNTKLLGQPELYGFASQLFEESGEINDLGKERVAEFVAAFIPWVESQK